MMYWPIQSRVMPWLRTHKWRLLALFAGVLAPLWLFGALAEEVLEQEPFAFDVPVLLFLHSRSSPLLDRVMILFSLLGYPYGVVPIGVGMALALLAMRRWGDAFFWIVAVGGAGLLNLLAKAAFGRIRPDLWLSPAPETTYSFPSGHAMGSMAMVAALVVLLWPTRWRGPALLLGVPFVVLVGVSRMYLGVHYPSDILAGWAAAVAWVLGVSTVLYRGATKATPAQEPARAA
jgi:membrane-associated phospholipid phosphatase